MKITIITLFPNMFKGFLEESIVKRAQEKGAVSIEIVNLRDFAEDTYKTVDDRPYGGGAGMVLKVDILHKALQSVGDPSASPQDDVNHHHIILTSAKGKVFNQKKARELSKQNHLVIIAGHYEEVDERAKDFIHEEISLGDFILTGGEIPAAAIIDAVVRLLPGVLKKDEATEQESFFEVNIDELISVIGENDILKNLKSKGLLTVSLLEYPQYTRPEEFLGKKVPEVLLSGNHAEIKKWQLRQAFEQTIKKRPDLLQ